MQCIHYFFERFVQTVNGQSSAASECSICAVRIGGE